jgi:hypothetical protein
MWSAIRAICIVGAPSGLDGRAEACSCAPPVTAAFEARSGAPASCCGFPRRGAVNTGRAGTGAALSGAALVTASALTRFCIFEAGRAAARDPKYTVGPQRDRLRERTEADA